MALIPSDASGALRSLIPAYLHLGSPYMKLDNFRDLANGIGVACGYLLVFAVCAIPEGTKSGVLLVIAIVVAGAPHSRITCRAVGPVPIKLPIDGVLLVDRDRMD